MEKGHGGEAQNQNQNQNQQQHQHQAGAAEQIVGEPPVMDVIGGEPVVLPQRLLSAVARHGSRCP